MTVAEISAKLARGRAAFVAWVADLVQQVADLRAQVTELRAELTAAEAHRRSLTAQLQTLEARLHLDSHNSSKAPSSDQPHRRRHHPPSRAPRSTRPSGGQPGHPGHTLVQVADPDQVVGHRPEACTACGTPFRPGQAADARHVRQVWDVPPLRLTVTEHQVWEVACECCGHVTAGAFPPEVRAPVQYGPYVHALAGYLNVRQLVPLARLREFFSDVLGHPLSEASLLTGRGVAAAALAPFQDHLRAQLAQAPVVGADETGCYVAGKRQWVHVLCTPALTDFELSTRRGTQTLATHTLLQPFAGVLLHDAYDCYFQYPCPHALCNAHLLRDLIFLAEEADEPLALAWQYYLRQLYGAVQAARAQGRTRLPPATLKRWEQKYTRLLSRSLATTAEVLPPPGRKRRPKQSKARNVWERLRDRRAAILRFARDFRVPFDNNQAERDLRMLKVQQKISGNFRSWTGAEEFLRVYGYLLTAQKNGVGAFRALTMLFAGHPYWPPAPM